MKHDPTGRLIRDKAFAKRLSAVCDASDQVPAYNFGRLTWVRDQMAAQFNEKVSVESIRKWFSGEVRPRPEKIRMLSQLLKVDEAWLTVGVTPELAPDEKKQRVTSTNGAVNILAGYLMISGWTVAFPSSPDLMEETGVDVYGIRRGKQYFFSVPLGVVNGKEVRFEIVNQYEQCVLVGVIPVSPTQVHFVAINHDVVKAHGVKRGSHINLALALEGDGYRVGGDLVNQIRDFAELG
jgi:transcriptional regulator with XRE-family HTH domain